MDQILKDFHDYISQELEYTGVNKNDFNFPILEEENIKCILNCRYWSTPNSTTRCCVLLFTTTDERKLKLPVFMNRQTRNYNPTSQIKENFCVRNDLKLNQEFTIKYSKSNKSEKIYLREIIL